MANRAFKYRIYPNEDQITLFAKTFGCCRKVWNLMLSDRIDGISHTPAFYKTEYAYLKEVDSMALANVGMNLKRAFDAYYNSKKHSKKHGFPKYKSKKHIGKKSYTTNSVNHSIRFEDDGIRLPKVGLVKAKLHRLPDLSWKLKSATVSLLSDGKYYISVLFEYDVDVKPVADPDSNAIGLDYKSNGLYMDSNGVCPHMPRHYNKLEKKLAREQRKLSRRCGYRKGEEQSNCYKKQKKRVNKIHRKIANQRNDFLHKRSTEIANQYDMVCVETLDMQAMANKGFGNGKATYGNGYGMFLTMLSYKLADRGKVFVKVNKWFPSSQICSVCGSRHKMPLDIRVYDCEDCGNHMDRDLNAAVNILAEGIRMYREAC